MTISRNKIALFTFFLLFLGIGRMFSLVTHDPVLGYANSYDMIRLQACHQIWPADKAVDIAGGTPAAPLRKYTLGKHLDTPCFPSSELLFTGIGIEAGKLKNIVTGEKLVSIKTIGLIKACFLAVTSLLASIYFYRRALYGPLLANSMVTLLVLSDPGITLYMNTFYTEFSAVYFLYLGLLGVVILAHQQWRPGSLSFLAAGLTGLGLSQPQHITLALVMGVLLAVFSATKRQWKTASALLLCAFIPVLVQSGGYLTPNNESVLRSNRINLTGSLLNMTDLPEQLLADLGLPANCKVLAGRNAYDADIQKKNICPAVNGVSKVTILLTLIKNPALLSKASRQTLLQSKNWVFDLYGQVERSRTESASRYQRTINDAIRLLPDNFFPWLALATALIPILLLGSDAFFFALLLVLLQWIVLGSAFINNGLVGMGKNMHLYVPLMLATLLLPCVAWSIKAPWVSTKTTKNKSD
jgi:hypothetical protein